MVVPWLPPDLFDGVTVEHLRRVQQAINDGEWRENVQSKATWAGVAVAGILGLDIDRKADRSRIAQLLKQWIANGALKIVRKADGRSEIRPYVEVGNWVDDEPSALEIGAVRAGAEVPA